MPRLARRERARAVVDPKKPTNRIAQLICMLGSDNNNERRNAWAALEQTMQNKGVGWSDIGNAFEHAAECDGGKYTEAEMVEFAQAARAEGIEAGIRIGLARAAWQRQSERLPPSSGHGRVLPRSSWAD